jgi:hypothetical protein
MRMRDDGQDVRELSGHDRLLGHSDPRLCSAVESSHVSALMIGRREPLQSIHIFRYSYIWILKVNNHGLALDIPDYTGLKLC